jgi:homoserine kinase type II
LEKNWNSNLPGGVLHLDLFPDNVFFDKDNKLTGIIDFYFSANDLFIYDIAIVINSWCFDENNKFHQDRFDAVFKGYKEIREISKAEMDFLNIALIGASLRFLLTRLYDYFFTPKDSIVNVKNPDEYLQKIRFFNQK